MARINLDHIRHAYGAKAKAKILGVNAKARVKAGTSGVKAAVCVGRCGRLGKSGEPGNPGDPTGPGIGSEIAGLSSEERRELKMKCPSVVANPAAYNRDAVQVCRVLAQLAGL